MIEVSWGEHDQMPLKFVYVTVNYEKKMPPNSDVFFFWELWAGRAATPEDIEAFDLPKNSMWVSFGIPMSVVRSIDRVSCDNTSEERR